MRGWLRCLIIMSSSQEVETRMLSMICCLKHYKGHNRVDLFEDSIKRRLLQSLYSYSSETEQIKKRLETKSADRVLRMLNKIW